MKYILVLFLSLVLQLTTIESKNNKSTPKKQQKQSQNVKKIKTFDDLLDYDSISCFYLGGEVDYEFKDLAKYHNVNIDKNEDINKNNEIRIQEYSNKFEWNGPRAKVMGDTLLKKLYKYIKRYDFLLNYVLEKELFKRNNNEEELANMISFDEEVFGILVINHKFEIQLMKTNETGYYWYDINADKFKPGTYFVFSISKVEHNEGIQCFHSKIHKITKY